MDIQFKTNGIIDKPLKELAVKRFGDKKDSFDRAIEEALTRWVLMMVNVERTIDDIIKAAKNDDKVDAVILFGSFAREESTFNDVDVGILARENEDYEKVKEKYAFIAKDNKMIDVDVLNSMLLSAQINAIRDAQLIYSRKENSFQKYVDKTEKLADDIRYNRPRR